MKLCIDAGHGGKDSGAVGINGRREKDDNLTNALLLQQEMIARGHTVVMTRTTDSYPALTARADLANREGCNYFISLHENSADAGANGIETLAGLNSSQTSRDMAELISRKVVEITGLTLRRGNGLLLQNATVLNQTTMPANTVELGFITNANDMAVMDAKRHQLIKGIADVLEKHFGAVASSVDTTCPTIGRIWSKINGVSVNLYVDDVTDNQGVERVEFRAYPKGCQALLRVIQAKKDTAIANRWLRGLGDFPALFDGITGRYVVRARAYDAEGNVSESTEFIYIDV